MKKKLISTLLVATMLLSSGTTLAYNDTKNHWAETYINNMNNAGVLEQFEEKNIYPDRPMNRAECAELISDLLEKYYGYTPPYDDYNFKFNDLTDGTRNTNKIRALSRLCYYSGFTSPTDDTSLGAYASLNRIIDGYPNGNFEPYNNVTRAEFAKMLISALDCLGHLMQGNSGWYYSDARNMNHWGHRYIDICYGLQIMNGYNQIWVENDRNYIEFRPDGLITRAEAIKMISSARNVPYVGLPGESSTWTSTRYKWDKYLFYIDILE